jgi:hypothetical protein
MTNLLVIGLLAAIYKDKSKCIDLIKKIIQNDYEYECVTIDSDYITNYFNLITDKNNNKIDRQYLRDVSRLDEILVISSIKIMKENLIKRNCKNCVYLIEFLQTKEECDLLRQLFGLNFFLISLVSSNRKDESFNLELSKSKFFFHSDAFLNMNDTKKSSIDLKRFLDLIFGNPFVTPNKSNRIFSDKSFTF